MNHDGRRAPRPATTRSTPSAPMPPCRSHSWRTSSALSDSWSSRSGKMTKSFPVPWPLAYRKVTMLAASGRGMPDDIQCRARRHRIGGGQPAHSRVTPEPRLLTAGEPSCRDDRLVFGFLSRPLAVDEPQHLRVAESPAGGPALTQTRVDQLAYLADQARLPRLPDPGLDPHVKLGSRNVKAELHRRST